MTGKQAMDTSAFNPEVLADIMAKRGIDAVGLAEQMGTSPVTIAQWLAGISRPRGASLRLLAIILKTKPETFLEE
jgi:transcriptional regulator with XRE-family HTH domain